MERCGTCGPFGFPAPPISPPWLRASSASPSAAIFCGPSSPFLLGVAMGTFFMAFHSAQGPQLGLPQMIQSRPQFGFRGALLVWVVALVAYIGYNAFNQVLAAQAFHQLVKSASPTSPVTIILFTILAVAFAVLGYDLIHVAQRWIAYVMMAMLTIFSVAVLAHGGLPANAFDIGAFRTVPFLAQLFAAAAYQLSWSIYVSDYSRYLPQNVSVKATFWWTCVGASLGGGWMMLVGTASASFNPGMNVAAAMQSAADAALPGFGTPLVFASMLGLLTISSLNFYGASLTLLGVVDSFTELKCTVAQRMLSLVVVAVDRVLDRIAVFARLHQFVRRSFVGCCCICFTPWTAINLIDFYVVRKGHYSVREIFNPNGMYGRWNWRGLTSYAIGFISMIPFFQHPALRGSRRARAGRRRYCDARWAAGIGAGVPSGLPVSGPRGGSTSGARCGCRTGSVADSLKDTHHQSAGKRRAQLTTLGKIGHIDAFRL